MGYWEKALPIYENVRVGIHALIGTYINFPAERPAFPLHARVRRHDRVIALRFGWRHSVPLPPAGSEACFLARESRWDPVVSRNVT